VIRKICGTLIVAVQEGDKTKFAKLEWKEEGFVTFGDNNKGRILGNGVIGNRSSFNIKNVLLVEGLNTQFDKYKSTM